MMMPMREPEALMRRQTSKPSMSGSITSSRATPKSSFCSSSFRASSPEEASMGS